MIKRINNYLLTQYPLVWNTRLLWVAIVNVLLHLFFYIGGFSAVSVTTIAKYYTVGSIGGFDMQTLSVLCSLIVLIVWCAFYLRNNAFKNFYRISRWWLAKEFIILFFIIVTSITYFMSFQWGVRTRIRSITNQPQLEQEANAVNTAAVYLPYDRSAYFVLNTCAEKNKREKAREQIEITNIDTATIKGEADRMEDSTGRQEQDARIKEALRRPNAFSYLHYCNYQVTDGGTDGVMIISQRNQRWLQGGQKDSVRKALQALFPVLEKYKIEYRLEADTILRDVFSDSLFTVNIKIAEDPFTYVNGYQVPNSFYMQRGSLGNVFRLVEDCQLTKQNLGERLLEWLMIGYTTLSLAILLLCYRRFSRKVFLISVVGTLVWAVLLSVLMAGIISSGNGFLILFLVLNAAFLGAGLMLLKRKSNKTLSGVLLNWHAFIVSYTIPAIAGWMQLYYTEQLYTYDYVDREAMMRQRFPISYWVEQHSQTIFALNLLISFVYIAVLFNHWAKQWQAAPEE